VADRLILSRMSGIFVGIGVILIQGAGAAAAVLLPIRIKPHALVALGQDGPFKCQPFALKKLVVLLLTLVSVPHNYFPLIIVDWW